jgi:ABC-2 type transport system ATP-binding protein
MNADERGYGPLTVLEVRGLTKVYRQIRALEAVSFTVLRGEIFGLIGADGAGKTTAFQILAGVMEASSGEVRVLGAPARASRDKVGYLTQRFSLYADLSVIENLRFSAGLRQVSEADFEERRARYLPMFDMARFEDRLAGRLSGGMKQKLALTCALIASPEVLLLDEPTTGVDPVSRREFWRALARLSAEGMTIVVATPYLDEAERCTRVALMERGRIVQMDEPARLRAALGRTRLEVRSGELGRAETLLAGGAVEDVQRFGDRLDVLVADPERGEESVRNTLGRAGIQVESVKRSEPTLENAFVATLRQMRGRQTEQEFPGRQSRRERLGEPMLRASGLHKRFGSFVAVKDFDVEIKRGEICGLLGANGAGKTTAIKMMCGLLAPTRGQVSLLGQTSNLRSAAVRSRIGYMSQKFTLYDDLTIGENLDFYARLYGVPDAVRDARKQWVLKLSELEGEQRLLTAQLPGGWKQRVAFGCAVMHEPDLIFLDEPTSGVDPLARRAMWRMINALADHGAAILVVTHYLEEAEQCARIGFMVAGEILLEGSPGAVKREGPLHDAEASLEDVFVALIEQREAA